MTMVFYDTKSKFSDKENTFSENSGSGLSSFDLFLSESSYQ